MLVERDLCRLASQDSRDDPSAVVHEAQKPSCLKRPQSRHGWPVVSALPDLEFAPHRHIEGYLNSRRDTSDAFRLRLAQEAIEAVVLIHTKGIIHSDLAARQFLLDADLRVHLSYFGFSSLNSGDVLGFENSSHHMPRDIDGSMPSTTQLDLFALGSTLYEIMTGRRPYEGKSDDAIVVKLTGRPTISTAYRLKQLAPVMGLNNHNAMYRIGRGRCRVLAQNNASCT